MPETDTKTKDTLLKEKFIKCLPQEAEKIVQFNSKKSTMKEILEQIEPVLQKFDAIKPLEELDLNTNYIKTNRFNNKKQFNHNQRR